MESTTPSTGDQPLPPADAAGPRPDAGARGSDGFFDSLRRTGLVRTQDRWIGGVAGGLARRFGVDPLLVRGLLGVAVLLGGAGLVLYGLAWALLPEEADGRIHLQETVRGRFDAALLGALAFVIVGANRGTGWWHGWWDDAGLGWVNGLLWLAAIAALVAVLVSMGGRRSRGPAAGPTPSGTWAPPPPPPGSSRAVPHPGYGTVPLAQPAPPGPAWPGPAGAAAYPPPPSGPGGYASAGPSAPGGWGGSGTTAPPPAPPAGPRYAPAPPRPPRPRVLGPGVGMVGTVVGLTLLALAALLVLEREGALGQPVGLTAVGIGIVLAGLGILVSGLRGRRSGTLGFLAVLGVLVAGPLAFVPGTGAGWGPGVGDGARTGIARGETWRPTTAAEARRGLQVGLGDVTVDLTDVPLDGGRVVEVPIRMGAGDLEVVVPEDVAVTGEIALRAGGMSWEVDGSTHVAGVTGGRGAEQFESDEVAERGGADLAIRITAGAGDIRVVEEDR